jgi:hypothetical protein
MAAVPTGMVVGAFLLGRFVSPSARIRIIEPVGPPSPRGVRLVRVRSRVGEPGYP